METKIKFLISIFSLFIFSYSSCSQEIVKLKSLTNNSLTINDSIFLIKLIESESINNLFYDRIHKSFYFLDIKNNSANKPIRNNILVKDFMHFYQNNVLANFIVQDNQECLFISYCFKDKNYFVDIVGKDSVKIELGSIGHNSVLYLINNVSKSFGKTFQICSFYIQDTVKGNVNKLRIQSEYLNGKFEPQVQIISKNSKYYIEKISAESITFWDINEGDFIETKLNH